MKSICEHCFHSCVCDEYQESKRFADNKSCMYADSHFVDVDRLRELAEADKDGRCVILPCKVGGAVYRKGRFSDNIIESIAKSIIINRFGTTIKAETAQNAFTFNDDEFGKTVFLTREAAEKALEAQNNDKETL